MMSCADRDHEPSQDEPTNDVGHPVDCACPECMPELHVATPDIAGRATAARHWLTTVEKDASPGNVMRLGWALTDLATLLCPGGLPPRRATQFAGWRAALVRIGAAARAGAEVASADELVLEELARWQTVAAAA
jgi:hypothetical protein